MDDTDELKDTLFEACKEAAATVGDPLRALEDALPEGEERDTVVALHQRANQLLADADAYLKPSAARKGGSITNSGGGDKNGD